MALSLYISMRRVGANSVKHSPWNRIELTTAWVLRLVKLFGRGLLTQKAILQGTESRISTKFAVAGLP